jgi:hypothetical protein
MVLRVKIIGLEGWLRSWRRYNEAAYKVVNFLYYAAIQSIF